MEKKKTIFEFLFDFLKMKNVSFYGPFICLLKKKDNQEYFSPIYFCGWIFEAFLGQESQEMQRIE